MSNKVFEKTNLNFIELRGILEWLNYQINIFVFVSNTFSLVYNLSKLNQFISVESNVISRSFDGNTKGLPTIETIFFFYMG